jgi:formylglycine-generating enzyme required for sulfatase activity
MRLGVMFWNGVRLTGNDRENLSRKEASRMSTLKKLSATFILISLFTLMNIAAAQDSTPEATPSTDATTEALSAGDTRVDEMDVEQVWVPAGCFQMGTSDEQAEYAETLDAPSWASRRISSEQPVHEVCLTERYWIDRTEVTNAAFQLFVDAGGYTTPDYWSEDGLAWLDRQNVDNLPKDCGQNTEGDAPRVCVTWFEAEAYANWRGGALPTEAQWEYAARGPESLIYPWGNKWDAELANVDHSDEALAVGSLPEGASWVGALDMAGNAMEWVQDWLSDDYGDIAKSSDPVEDPTGPEEGRIKIEKGGWFGSNAVAARSAYRHFEDPPAYYDHHIGFRVVTMDSELVD